MTTSPSKPRSDVSDRDANSLHAELAHIRERFTVIEEIDRRTSELIARLAEAVRESAEVRATASLDIAGGLQRVERMLTGEQERQRSTLTGLMDEVSSAQSRASTMAVTVRELERALIELQARVEAGSSPADRSRSVPERATQADTPTSESRPQSGSQSRAVMIEIERVPSASVALALQRMIAGVDRVTSVTARDFEGGVVRFSAVCPGGFSATEIVDRSRAALMLVRESEREARFELIDPAKLSPAASTT